MKKRSLIMIVFAVLVVALAAVVIALQTFATPLVQTITAKGYQISVPKGWTCGADGSLINKRGEVLGKFLLIQEEPDLNRMTDYCGFAVKKTEKSESLTQVITKNSLQTEQGEAVQYFIQDIPNPAPYAISLTFLRTKVHAMTAERIVASLTLPELGAKPPKKNVSAPSYADIHEGQTASFVFQDGTTSVKNIHLIDAFMRLQNKQESTGLDIFSYEQTAEGEQLSAWYHIESNQGKGYLYSYYPLGDGVYTYDNSPILFESITKDILQEKGITAYHLTIGNADLMRLLEIPTNVYRDYAEDLIKLQTAESNEQTVRSILEKIMAPEQLSSVSISKSGKTIRLAFSDVISANRAKLSQDMAVLFRLLLDIDTIVVEEPDETVFRFSRNQLLKWVGKQNDEKEDAVDAFASFAEQIETVPPAKAEGESQNTQEIGTGDVVYATTMFFAPTTKIKHPKTGEMVAIGPYAERFGVSQYLNRPIYCVIKRNGMAYIATAMVDGSVIYSQPLETEADVQNAIAQLNMYS